MIYKINQEKYRAQRQILQKKSNNISLARILLSILFVFLMYQLIQNTTTVIILAIFFTVGSFFYLVKIHSKINDCKKHFDALITVNENEISFLENQSNPFDDGTEFIDQKHDYAFDLDIFGQNSVFQYFNRTNTFVGKQSFASLLKNILPQNAIIEHQLAVKELSENIDFRQNFMASAINANDSQQAYERLLLWSKSQSKPFSKMLKIYAFASPTIFLIMIIAYFLTDNSSILTFIIYQFIANVSIFGLVFKKNSAEIQYISEIETTIKNYGLIIENIENHNFKSKKLQYLKSCLKYENKSASSELKKLASVFGNMDTINNIVTTTLFNGIFMFHIHIFNQLLSWKKTHAIYLEKWLSVIGEFETINSLSNFSYNNPAFVFPKINHDHKISFENLVHPLINDKKRIENSIGFQPQNFFILTGSNMSGKSTFLRSLGLNMVLAGTGSVVCATNATVHTMPILVSMRTSDSIVENESYFFAEIKRLKNIIDSLNTQKSFVLLDEILRGTNSDDKQTGTIAIIEKMISKNAIGVIATHDIEVCLTTGKYPNILANKCFEAQIIDNDLHFDYKLRDGVCKNKSATFLMQKLDII